MISFEAIMQQATRTLDEYGMDFGRIELASILSRERV